MQFQASRSVESDGRTLSRRTFLQVATSLLAATACRPEREPEQEEPMQAPELPRPQTTAE